MNGSLFGRLGLYDPPALVPRCGASMVRRLHHLAGSASTTPLRSFLAAGRRWFAGSLFGRLGLYDALRSFLSADVDGSPAPSFGRLGLYDALRSFLSADVDGSPAGYALRSFLASARPEPQRVLGL